MLLSLISHPPLESVKVLAEGLANESLFHRQLFLQKINVQSVVIYLFLVAF